MLLIRFFGGKGGVGKTTLAAAFATAQARRGVRTLVVSTDPAHSLGDVLDTSLSEEPRAVADDLLAAEISGENQAERRVAEVLEDARHAVPREVLPAVERHLRRAVDSPGTVESALLDRLTGLVERTGRDWDLLVVDSAPTGHMLRLVSLPELLTPWIEGLTRNRRRARDIDAYADGLLGERGAREERDPLLERLHARRRRLDNLRHRLRTDARVHLVLVPERLPLAETERAADRLAEAGLPLGAVLVNRVAADAESGVLARRRGQERAVLARVRERFADVVTVPLLPGALAGVEELAEPAEWLADL
ncbi:ArsA family ATPase [Prauserella rugosa]|uniref:Arsenite-transporting ATPase n=1 Tax=Prauserella rugosa TaxID=43354 RepID=A0A660C9I8_9PSEU|nr:TRC40/GET3/ArsA family transport-energizing ATPase [Prauserella rugosa]KMS83514.1 arsenic ABC transporter ATPase [Streptomyces regensis]TWH18473.1 arsenite-transporting ATPase [Prauserella rugosa]